MKLRIVGDGTRKGTHVENADTGETLEGVVCASWEMNAGVWNESAYVTLRLEQVYLDVIGYCYDVRGIPVVPKDKT